MRKPIASQTEKDIESACTKLAKSLGVMPFKFTSPAQRSVPDKLFLVPGTARYPNGQVIFVEFKRPGGKATPAQEVLHRRMREHDAQIYTCDSLELFKEILDKHRF